VFALGGYNCWLPEDKQIGKVFAMKVRIIISREDGGSFLATCPSLPGCHTRGQSLDEVKQKIDDAIFGYIAAVADFVPEHLAHEVVEA
jgi:predicted RNase H-like HicB family nuclease